LRNKIGKEKSLVLCQILRFLGGLLTLAASISMIVAFFTSVIINPKIIDSVMGQIFWGMASLGCAGVCAMASLWLFTGKKNLFWGLSFSMAFAVGLWGYLIIATF